MGSTLTASNRWQPRRAIWTVLGAATIGLAAFVAYANIFDVPLQFDDVFTIAKNPSLHQWLTALSPPAGTTVGGRPVLNASFALNYALGGEAVSGYHAFNLLIHVLAGLTLWGLATRTLGAIGRNDPRSDRLGFLIAMLWTLHPLQTESVTYLSQRAESLMGLFYLLTCYAFVRGTQSVRPLRWWIAAILACLLGMGTKEVMVSAPLMVLLYDRTFIAGSFGAAWRSRKTLYLGLAATWLPLIYLVASQGGNRGGSTGFGVGVSWWDYLLTQFSATLHYLRLIVWPHPLVFEYGPVQVPSLLSVAPQAALLAGMLALTAVGLVRRSPWAFLSAWFFATLAPTSLVPGAIQMISEHRMYLGSAAIISLLVVAVDAAAIGLRMLPGRARFGLGLAATAVAAAFAGVTFARNHDYRSILSLWSDTVAKRPAHALARYNLALELSRTSGGVGEAIQQYEEALRLNPRLSLVHYNLAVLLETVPARESDALEHYRLALAIDPNYAAAQNNLGTALARQGRASEAVAYLEAAQRLEPNSNAISRNLGTTLFMCGRFQDAVVSYERALQLEPNDAVSQRNLGLALQKLGRNEEATAHFAQAARLESAGPPGRP